MRGVARLRALVAGALAVAGACGMTASSAKAEDPDFLTFGAGVFDIIDDETTGAVSLEYMSSRKFWIFKPVTGLMGTFEGGLYAHAGLALDLYFGNRWVLTPSFAAGLYADGGGKDLGSIVEFRSSVAVAYRFDDRSRVGLQFYHLSNAGLDDRNPGTELLMLTYSLPLERGAR